MQQWYEKINHNIFNGAYLHHGNLTRRGFGKSPCTNLVRFQQYFGPIEYANNIQVALINTKKLTKKN